MLFRRIYRVRGKGTACFVHRENIIAARVTSGMELGDAPCLPYSLNYLKRPLWRYNGTSRCNTFQHTLSETVTRSKT